MEESHWKWTKEQVDALGHTPVKDVLRALGFDDEGDRSGMFFSPFRKENTRSFHVKSCGYLWIDFGDRDMGRQFKRNSTEGGGNAIILAQCLGYPNFKDACEFLAGLSANTAVRIQPCRRESERPATESSIKVESVLARIEDRDLREYATITRRIPEDILDAHCVQVNYAVTYNDFRSGTERVLRGSAIGFRHIDGTYTLRKRPQGNFRGKLSTGSNFTVILPDGTKPSKTELSGPASKTVLVFEGFFNALSLLAFNHRTAPGFDVVVLNGVGNKERALDFISAHENVVLYLDNDLKSRTGEKTSAWIEKESREKAEADGRDIRIINNMMAYGCRGFNDVNEAWVARCDESEKKNKVSDLGPEYRRRRKEESASRAETNGVSLK